MSLGCAVFASGNGSNFQALINRKTAGDLDVDFKLFIGNNSKAGSFEIARKEGIKAVHMAPSHYGTEKEYNDKLMNILESENIELIILAGYMKKLPSELVHKFRHRIVNIHPGLLPAFGGKGMYGSKVHQAVLDYGAKVTGITVHFVDEKYDHGPVILQKTVNVEDTDDVNSLAKRVLAVEHDNYWKAIEAIAQKKIKIEGRRVFWNV